jgi:hypothetical protein
MALVAVPLNTQGTGYSVSTGAFDQTDLLRIPSVDPNFWYGNRGAMFLKYLQLLGGSQSVDQPRHEFFNDDKFSTVVTPSITYADTATTVILNESSAVAPRAVLYNTDSEEAIYVTAVSGATLTVVRGHQGTTAAEITSTDKLLVLETSLPEGADHGLGIAKIPTKDYAVTSFYSESISGTDLQEATNMLQSTGQIAGQMGDYTYKVMEQMDNSLRWSKRDIDTTTDTDGTLYYTGGFNTSVTTNNKTLVGDLTWQSFNTAFVDIYDQTESSNNKTLICGPTLFSKINAVSWGHFVDGDSTPQFLKVLGDRMTAIQLENGGVMTLLRDAQGFSTDKGVAHKGFLVDPAFIQKIQFENWDMIWRDVTRNGSHTNQTEVFGSSGLKIPREEMHSTVAWSAT